MNPDQLKIIIDEVFSALETVTASKPMLHMIVGVIHMIALSLIPTIAPKIKVP